ncbi:MAG: hypothetical protein HY290_10880 [Planctomycetia bacterium]|nr:hypothetical protein [Planctomycetia bacterium]
MRRSLIADAAGKKLGYPIVIDSLPADGRRRWGHLFDQFAVSQIPLTIVVDRNGKVAAHGSREEMLTTASQLAREQLSKDKRPLAK